MMQLDILRALAGIAASETMSKEVRDKAAQMMLDIMNSLESVVSIEKAALKKESAAMNGIIS